MGFLELQLLELFFLGSWIWAFLYGFSVFFSAILLGTLSYLVLGIGLLLIIALFVFRLYFLGACLHTSVADKVLGEVERKAGGSIVIGHRGAGLDAPENSLAAFKYCSDNGCKVVEVDLSVTSDGVGVLFHDDEVDRLTDGSGDISALTYDEVKRLDLGVKFPISNKFEGERIPQFETALEECLNLGLNIIIDLKTYEIDSRCVAVVIKAFKRFPELYDRAVVSSFFVHHILMLRLLEPRIACCMAWRPSILSYKTFSSFHGARVRRFDSYWQHIVAVFGDVILKWCFFNMFFPLFGLCGALITSDSVNQEMIVKFNKIGVRVVAWTLNSLEEKRYAEKVLRISYMTDTLLT